ncbi:S1 family peptidase [Lentzea alba]|uniref:hypothetical protein n=1 Tax=Lentzea alba TaxID=2714351 RepID=UPI0039BF9832
MPTDADNWMWDGGSNTNNFTKRVDGRAEARPGFTVCQSGSTSGAVCNIRNRTETAHEVCGIDVYGNRKCYNDLFVAEHVDPNTIACRGGDSGGPVFTLVGSNAVTAGARSPPAAGGSWPTRTSRPRYGTSASRRSPDHSSTRGSGEIRCPDPTERASSGVDPV